MSHEHPDARSEAAARLLAVAATGRRSEPDWSETKAFLEHELNRGQGLSVHGRPRVAPEDIGTI